MEAREHRELENRDREGEGTAERAGELRTEGRKGTARGGDGTARGGEGTARGGDGTARGDEGTAGASAFGAASGFAATKETT